MGVKLVELKTNADYKSYAFMISAIGHFLDYEGACLGDKQVKEYLKENPFPKDKHYSEEDFLHDIHAEGSVIVNVEKEETAEFLAELFQELV